MAKKKKPNPRTALKKVAPREISKMAAKMASKYIMKVAFEIQFIPILVKRRDFWGIS